MQRQLQELQLVKAELEGLRALEEQAVASLREAAGQMAAAQEIAAVAREKEAEAAVAMRRQGDLTEAMEALREEVEQLYESRQRELDAADAARLDAEADAAVEKATVASERARADALRDAAQQMEEELRVVHEHAAARVSAAEERAQSAEQKLLKLQTDGQATAHETQRLVERIEEEAAAKISQLESSASAAASQAAEANSELATLSARLRAGELHLSAAIEKFESEREEAVRAALATAKEERDAAVQSATSSLEAEHTEMHKVALARINSLCDDLKAQGDELESLREENAQLRTKLLDGKQSRRQEAATMPGAVSSDSTPRDNLSSPTARVGPAVALIAATRRTDGLEQEVISLRQEVLRLQNKVAGYRAREQKIIKATKHSGLRGGSPDRAIRAAQREQQRLLREAGRRKRPLNRESTHVTVVASSDAENEFLQVDEEDGFRLSVQFDDGRLRSASKARRKVSPRSSRVARDHTRTIGTQTVDEVVLVADIEPLLVELPDALSQEVSRRQRAEELLHELYQAQQDVVRHSPQAAAAPAKAVTVEDGVDEKIRNSRTVQQENFGPEHDGLHLDAQEDEDEEAEIEAEADDDDNEDGGGGGDDDDDDDDEMHKRWQSWNDEIAMPPTPKRGDNNGLTIISTGDYSSEDDADDTGAPAASAIRVDEPPTDLRRQAAVLTDSSTSVAQDRWALRVDAAVAATMPLSPGSSPAAPVNVESAGDQSQMWESNQGLGLDDSVQDIILDKHDADNSARISPSGGVSPPALTLAELNEIATRSVVKKPVDTPRPITGRGWGGKGDGGTGVGGRSASHVATASAATFCKTVAQQPSVALPIVDDAHAPVQELTGNGLSADALALDTQTDRELLEELEREEQPEDIDVPTALAEDGSDEVQEPEQRSLLVICPEGVHSGDPVSRVPTQTALAGRPAAAPGHRAFRFFLSAADDFSRGWH